MSIGTAVAILVILSVAAGLGLFAFGCPQVGDSNEPGNESEGA